ncbi:MAG: AtzE family amidohydrolase [Candidatus Rokubacteria bacterium]|nr:AtzE family amidohydrolase [Candidatus Rokubacteria bacterium]
MKLVTTHATEIAAAVRAGQARAHALVTAALEAISARDPALNCFTAVLADRALAEAAQVDAAVAAGRDPGPLAGVPFAVKNLFDVAGLSTLAGSRINREHPPARRDAAAVRRLGNAGAILLGALNMDEYACGFTTENSHYGPTRNPHDPSRVAGGSSGGSAAAVAAGLVPLALGSDTNGSIRVPAALCGVFGLKPTYGRISRAGTVLFSPSLDHVGPLARSVADLALAFDVLHGPDPADPVARPRPPEPCLPRLTEGMDGLRIAVADGHFRRGGDPEALEAVGRAATALGVRRGIEVPQVEVAEAAATIITLAEAGNVHLRNLRARARDFDPLTRDRLLAGALLPASAYLQAQRFRGWYRARLRAVFDEVDVLLTPTTPCVAPLVGTARMVVGGTEVAIRGHIGTYTRAFSFVGLPCVTVPVRDLAALPLGVQLVAAPYREADLLRVAAALEAQGFTAEPVLA